jgi:predicted DNA-binding ArsR family transcriptional regulator
MEVCDLLESLAFSPPKNLIEMYGWYYTYIKQNKLKPLDDIFYGVGLKYQRVKSFHNKLMKGFSDKEKIHVLDYLKSNETFIRAVFEMFKD